MDAYIDDKLDMVQTQTKEVGADQDFSVGYMRFSGNTGEYMHREDIVSHGTLWAFHVAGARAQWLAWSDGKVYKRKDAPILEGGFQVLPSKMELDRDEPCPIKRPQMDGWKATIVFPIRDMEGEYGQLEITLPAEGGGKRPRPAWILINEWLEYTKTHRKDGGTPIYVPIVEIGARGFDSQGGRKYAPVLKVEEWMTLEELNAEVAVADAETQVEEATPEEVEEAPSTGKRFGQRKGGRAA